MTGQLEEMPSVTSYGMDKLYVSTDLSVAENHSSSSKASSSCHGYLQAIELRFIIRGLYMYFVFDDE